MTMKAVFTSTGKLVKLTKEGELRMICPFAEARTCDIRCPHLDDSEPGYIRLTCGGTDVVYVDCGQEKEVQDENNS